MTRLSYEKKNNSLIMYCNWEQYEDFLVSVNAVKNKINEMECFMIPIEKEKELIKIVNYLNVVNNGKSRHSQTKYHRECSDDEEDEDRKKNSRVDFFKSFSKKNFINNKKKEKKKYTSSDSDDDKDDNEYSSSSYDTSSSDNFPSPRTPAKRSNYTNEQLYFMIEKMQRKINLIEKILEKKLMVK